MKSIYISANDFSQVDRWQPIENLQRRSPLSKDKIYIKLTDYKYFKIHIGKDIASLINFSAGDRVNLSYDKLDYSKIKIEKSSDYTGHLLGTSETANTIYFQCKFPRFIKTNLTDSNYSTEIDFDFDYGCNNGLILDLSKII